MNRDEWLQERRKGIGGSDVAAILGMSKWKTPLQVYLDKIGEAEDMPDNDSMFWGRALEPVIRQKYADETGRIVRTPENILFSTKFPFMMANLDGYTDDQRVVEVKTARMGSDWGDPGTDQIPEAYLLQVQHYMAVTGFEVADVPVLIGGSDFRIYTVEADKDLHRMLEDEESCFWSKVQNRTPPDPVTVEDAQKLFKAKIGLSIEANTDVLKAIENLFQIRENLKDWEGQEERVKTAIMTAMGAADTLTSEGKTLVTWKESKGRETFDAKAFKAKYPDLYSQFTKTGAPGRRFLLK